MTRGSDEWSPGRAEWSPDGGGGDPFGASAGAGGSSGRPERIRLPSESITITLTPRSAASRMAWDSSSVREVAGSSWAKAAADRQRKASTRINARSIAPCLIATPPVPFRCDKKL